MGLKKPNIPALTSLRFFAAIYVVIFHAQYTWLQAATVAWPRWFLCILNTGYVSVGFFFVLSGFVLAYTYGEKNRFAPHGAAFWMARFARIYPIYALSLLIGAGPALGLLLKTFSHSEAMTQFGFSGLLSFSMLQAWAPKVMSWNYPAWSLSAEAFFYLIFPAVGIWVWKLAPKRLLPAALGLGILAVLIPLSFSLWNGAAWQWPASEHNPLETNAALEFWHEIIKFNPAIRVFDFLLGIVIGRLYLLRGASEPTSKGLRGSHGLRALVATLGILWILANSDRIPALVLHDGLLDLLFAYIIFQFACDRGRLAKLLSLPFLVVLGEASYALYILHVPIRDWTSYFVRRFYGPEIQHPLALFFLYLIAVISISILAFRYFERPLQIRIRNAWATKRQGV
jgi:peptidoglycan/LPS O-acetylase OafA/YrhL